MSAPMPYLVTWATEEECFEFLSRLNTDGHEADLSCIDVGGHAFMATLTDPDADHVHHVVTNERGIAHCCNCEHDGARAEQWDPCAWRPSYPVTALCQFDPAIVRGLIEREGPWG